jgi:acyl-CoA reductase-like NAD-dependent aldehyde dehydrogenase
MSAGVSVALVNPATEEPIATVGLTSAEETDEAVARTHAAFPMWRAVAPGERARLLRRASGRGCCAASPISWTCSP